MGHVEYIMVRGHQVEIEQEAEDRIVGSCLCGISVRDESLVKVEQKLAHRHIRGELETLIEYFEQEMNDSARAYSLLEHLNDAIELYKETVGQK